MQTGTLVMMVLILGLVWGGFVALLMHSIKADKQRAAKLPVGDHGDD